MISVDPRMGSRKAAAATGTHGAPLVRELQQLGAEAKLRYLDAGDVRFSGDGPKGLLKVGIEIKTLANLLSDLTSGHLAGKQLPGLVRAYPFAYLILQGAWTPARDGSGVLSVPMKGGKTVPAGFGARRWAYGDLVRYLNTLHCIVGLKVIRVPSRIEIAYTVHALYEWWQKPWEKHKGHLGIYHSGPKKASLVVPSVCRTIADDIPHVGWEYSGVAEATFGSARRMINATPRQWATLRPEGETRGGQRRPRMGTKRAAQIDAALDEDCR